MAEGGNVPELGGYDYEFTSRVPDDLECLVCHLTLKDPVQIVECGHRLCNICMESLLRRPSPTCPADRQPLSREKEHFDICQSQSDIPREKVEVKRAEKRDSKSSGMAGGMPGMGGYPQHSGGYPAYGAAQQYVSAKGEKFEAAYQRALKSGKTTDKRVKVQVIGQDRVGKTSLVRSLKGEPFREDEISTDGVEMSQPLKNAGKQPWKDAVLPEDTTVYHHRVAECINSNLFTEIAPSVEESPTAAETDVAGPSQAFFRDDRDEGEEDLEERRIPPKIAKLVEVPEQGSSGSSDGIWPVIWDFAGQSVFRAIHPIFMTLAAVYILVFDLTKELSTTAQCHVREEGYDNVEIPAPDSEDTNLDHIMRWLDLVHSFSENNQSLPAVMLVGTHADGVNCDPKERMDAVINTFVDSAEVFHNHIEDTFIIDNTTAGQLGEEDPIVRLREEVLNVAEKLPHTKDEIPLTWFKVEDAIYGQVTQGGKYITTQKFKREIAEKICKFDMESDDFEVLLRYLHDRGTIVYHDRADNPDGLVVLDPQWLIEVLCKIVTIKTQRREKPRIRRDKGILRAELLEHSCKDQQVEDIQQPLVFIMKKFNLVCEWKHKDKSSDYVVPCMLTKNAEGDLVDPTLNQQEPVYIIFNTNYVPCGLFSRLLVFLWEWAASKTNCEEQQLFVNAARFIIGENTCAAFVCSKTVIKIYILVIDKSKPVEKDVSLDLIRVLKCRLNELRMECHWLRSVTWELCGKCPCKKCSKQMNIKTGKCFRHQEQGCSQDDCAHYVPVKRSPFACNCAKGRVLPVPQTWVQALQVETTSEEKRDVVKQGTPSMEELERLQGNW
ncbi:hypothetical protein ACROYT_G034174 [Oculina patagonica]